MTTTKQLAEQEKEESWKNLIVLIFWIVMIIFIFKGCQSSAIEQDRCNTYGTIILEKTKINSDNLCCYQKENETICLDSKMVLNKITEGRK